MSVPILPERARMIGVMLSTCVVLLITASQVWNVVVAVPGGRENASWGFWVSLGVLVFVALVTGVSLTINAHTWVSMRRTRALREYLMTERGNDPGPNDREAL